MKSSLDDDIRMSGPLFIDYHPSPNHQEHLENLYENKQFEQYIQGKRGNLHNHGPQRPNSTKKNPRNTQEPHKTPKSKNHFQLSQTAQDSLKRTNSTILSQSEVKRLMQESPQRVDPKIERIRNKYGQSGAIREETMESSASDLVSSQKYILTASKENADSLNSVSNIPNNTNTTNPNSVNNGDNLSRNSRSAQNYTSGKLVDNRSLEDDSFNTEKGESFNSAFLYSKSLEADGEGIKSSNQVLKALHQAQNAQMIEKGKFESKVAKIDLRKIEMLQRGIKAEQLKSRSMESRLRRGQLFMNKSAQKTRKTHFQSFLSQNSANSCKNGAEFGSRSSSHAKSYITSFFERLKEIKDRRKSRSSINMRKQLYLHSADSDRPPKLNEHDKENRRVKRNSSRYTLRLTDLQLVESKRKIEELKNRCQAFNKTKRLMNLRNRLLPNYQSNKGSSQSSSQSSSAGNYSMSTSSDKKRRSRRFIQIQGFEERGNFKKRVEASKIKMVNSFQDTHDFLERLKNKMRFGSRRESGDTHNTQQSESRSCQQIHTKSSSNLAGKTSHKSSLRSVFRTVSDSNWGAKLPKRSKSGQKSISSMTDRGKSSPELVFKLLEKKKEKIGMLEETIKNQNLFIKSLMKRLNRYDNMDRVLEENEELKSENRDLKLYIMKLRAEAQVEGDYAFDDDF